MKELNIITAKYEGRLRSLTVSQWASILNIPTKKLYNRKTIGLSDQDAIDGRYKRYQEKTKISDDQLSAMYQAFNFSHGVVNFWRQKNGIR